MELNPALSLPRSSSQKKIAEILIKVGLKITKKIGNTLTREC